MISTLFNHYCLSDKVYLFYDTGYVMITVKMKTCLGVTPYYKELNIHVGHLKTVACTYCTLGQTT